MTFIEKRAEDIDVLFYGSTNPRRNRILNNLYERDINVHSIFGKYGAERDSFIARAKILLNLHYFENGIFEIFRCSHLFANSKCVISEHGCDKDLDTTHAQSALFYEKENIADACLYYINHERERKEVEKRAFKEFSSTTLRESIWENKDTPLK